MNILEVFGRDLAAKAEDRVLSSPDSFQAVSEATAPFPQDLDLPEALAELHRRRDLIMDWQTEALKGPEKLSQQIHAIGTLGLNLGLTDDDIADSMRHALKMHANKSLSTSQT